MTQTDSWEFATLCTPTLPRMSPQQHAPPAQVTTTKAVLAFAATKAVLSSDTVRPACGTAAPKSGATVAHSTLSPVRTQADAQYHVMQQSDTSASTPGSTIWIPSAACALRPEASHYILVDRCSSLTVAPSPLPLPRRTSTCRTVPFATRLMSSLNRVASPCPARARYPPQKMAPDDIADTRPLALKKRLPASPYLQARAVGSGLNEVSPQPPIPLQHAVRACHISGTLHRAGKLLL
ncbi:hypothetical protein K438DRAFT_1991492 [Mycena galopus ATCC 62051]|nr:hypothetical protein K438DRAFT_1991492 [Mycena galopus ATCC 62051]